MWHSSFLILSVQQFSENCQCIWNPLFLQEIQVAWLRCETCKMNTSLFCSLLSRSLSTVLQLSCYSAGNQGCLLLGLLVFQISCCPDVLTMCFVFVVVFFSSPNFSMKLLPWGSQSEFWPVQINLAIRCWYQTHVPASKNTLAISSLTFLKFLQRPRQIILPLICHGHIFMPFFPHCVVMVSQVTLA